MFRKFVFFTLYLIYFLDLAGFALAYAALPPLIIDSKSSLISSSLSLSERNMILGCLIATYPLTQIFGAPILGALSDRLGRKPILLLSTLLTAAAFALSALAISFRFLSLLFLSRALSGFSAGNITLTQASATDLTEEKNRPSYMALFVSLGGMGWIIGSYIGNLLADSHTSRWFTLATPFWITAVCFCLSFLLLVWGFKESFQRVGKEKFMRRAFTDSVTSVFSLQKLAPPLIAALLTLLGWILYQSLITPYLSENYAFTEQWLLKICAYFSAWWFLGGLMANQWFIKTYEKDEAPTLLPFFLSASTVLSYLFFCESEGIWAASAIANFCQAIAIACFFSLCSLMGGRQGKISGFWNAGFAFASAVMPLLSSLLSSYGIDLPFLLSGSLLLLMVLYYLEVPFKAYVALVSNKVVTDLRPVAKGQRNRAIKGPGKINSRREAI